jgi:hypothetical protein
MSKREKSVVVEPREYMTPNVTPCGICGHPLKCAALVLWLS